MTVPYVLLLTHDELASLHFMLSRDCEQLQAIIKNGGFDHLPKSQRRRDLPMLKANLRLNQQTIDRIAAIAPHIQASYRQVTTGQSSVEEHSSALRIANTSESQQAGA